MNKRDVASVWIGIVLIGGLALSARGQAAAELPNSSDNAAADSVLTPEQWQRVDAASERALRWLAAKQESDGSFATLEMGQPGVTSLCVLAFMAQGEMPGQGAYGERLERAAGFVLQCQKENGLVTLVGPDGPEISRFEAHQIGAPMAYNHGISSLALSELYGSTANEKNDRLRAAITKSLRVSLLMQRWPKDRAVDEGGWRYVNDFNEEDSDLSVTGWELKFLRSARNAGFDVPKPAIDAAVAYVRRTYSQKYGAFGYAAGDHYDFRSRGMAGAGILALAHAGFHNAPEAKSSGEWILRHNFDRYNEIVPFQPGWPNDRYHYGLFNCCQGMYQLGGKYWEQFFPRVVETLLANQQADGSWPAESHFHDGQFGNCYTTALVLLTLGAPNQLLPIYQR